MVKFDKKIIVFEDIDCLSDIVLQRSIQTQQEKQHQSLSLTQGVPVLPEVKSISSLMGTDIDRIDSLPKNEGRDGMCIDLNFLLNLSI